MRCRSWVVALMAVTVVAVSAAPALAGHGAYVTNSPADASVYSASSPPTSVTVHFSDSGRLTLGVVRVYDQRGRVVSVGGSLADDDSTVEHPLPKLGAGNYVVAWRVTLADAYSVHGAFEFSVKAQKRSVNKLSRGTTSAVVPLGQDRITQTAWIITVVLSAIAFAAATSAVIRRRRSI